MSSIYLQKVNSQSRLFPSRFDNQYPSSRNYNHHTSSRFDKSPNFVEPFFDQKLNWPKSPWLKNLLEIRIGTILKDSLLYSIVGNLSKLYSLYFNPLHFQQAFMWTHRSRLLRCGNRLNFRIFQNCTSLELSFELVFWPSGRWTKFLPKSLRWL